MLLWKSKNLLRPIGSSPIVRIESTVSWATNRDMFNRIRECRHGTFVYNINDLFIGRSLDLYGEYSEGEVFLFNQLVGQGDTVIEAGANIGAHTVVFSRAAGESGHIYAFEPQRLVFQTLCANVAINSLTNVYCYQAALGSTPATIRVPAMDPREPRNFGGVEILKESARTEPVQIVRIDDLGLKSCRLIKVDVEGMEQQVLQGAADLVKRCKPFLYVENDRREKSIPLIQYIDSLGYELYWHMPNLFNPENFRQCEENVFGTMISQNMLCIPRGCNIATDGFLKISVP